MTSLGRLVLQWMHFLCELSTSVGAVHFHLPQTLVHTAVHLVIVVLGHFLGKDPGSTDLASPFVGHRIQARLQGVLQGAQAGGASWKSGLQNVKHLSSKDSDCRLPPITQTRRFWSIGNFVTLGSPMTKRLLARTGLLNEQHVVPPPRLTDE